MTFFLDSDIDTRRFGEALASLLRAGDVLALSGELGAGKTTLVQGLAWALGLPRSEFAPSPTYAIALTYPTTPVLHHLDLYRIEHGAAALLGNDYFTGDSITVIEWPERAPAWLPTARFELALERDVASESPPGDARRRATLRATDPSLAARLAAWRPAVA